MLAAGYGADITYGEEIVDHRLLRCTPKINKMLGTVDLVEKDTDTLVFSTWDEEKSTVVFQIETSDAVQAVQAANLVSGDIRSHSPSVVK
jgi:tRNA-dihydrouridine synthase 2